MNLTTEYDIYCQDFGIRLRRVKVPALVCHDKDRKADREISEWKNEAVNYEKKRL